MFATCTGKAMHHGWLLGVVIPARDEEAHIEDVLANLPPMVDLAVVINDGSTDNTGVLARQTDAPCKVVVLEGNGDGVGASIDRGHQHLLSEWRSPFISVVMAGDGQMNPDDMEALVQPIAADQADHVKGNRGMHAKGYNRMPKQRQRATAVLSLFTTLAAGQPIGDPQCGYTATSSTVLRAWAWDRSWAGYGYPNFWLINLAKLGFRLAEVPVQSIYRNEESGIKPLSFFFSVGWMMAVEHHRRNMAWLHPRILTPHTLFALIAYLLGWSALLPFFSNDLEIELVSRGIHPIAITLFFWSLAHLFDRGATRVHRELKSHATT